MHMQSLLLTRRSSRTYLTAADFVFLLWLFGYVQGQLWEYVRVWVRVRVSVSFLSCHWPRSA